MELIGRASVGAGLLRVEGDIESQAAVVERLRQSNVVAHATVRDAPLAVEQQIDAWGPLGASGTLASRVKRALDPAGILNAGQSNTDGGERAKQRSRAKVKRKATSKGHRSEMSSAPVSPSSAFDTIDTPSTTLIGACVHCGFCLPTCPTSYCGARRWTHRGAAFT